MFLFLGVLLRVPSLFFCFCVIGRPPSKSKRAAGSGLGESLFLFRFVGRYNTYKDVLTYLRDPMYGLPQVGGAMIESPKIFYDRFVFFTLGIPRSILR